MTRQWTGRLTVWNGPSHSYQVKVTVDMLRHALRFPTTCDAEVSRDGELDACNQPAIALRAYEFDGGVVVGAVCRGHIGDTEHTVPLSMILDVLHPGGTR